MSSDQYTEQESAEAWALVDMMQNIIANARDAPHYTAEEHALMGAGEIQREWLTAHDARVRRDAAREALDGYAGSLDILVAPFRHLEGDRVRHWRDTHYPEETP